MGFYLNNKKSCSLYQQEAAAKYFIDKTEILNELIDLVEQGGNYTCIARPRRFGKTVMANMISAFFGKGKDCREIFKKLKIGISDKFETHINQHNVIYISFNEVPDDCSSYKQYIARIRKRLLEDLKRTYPKYELSQEEPIWDSLNAIYELEDEIRFIFIFDEWDYIFHRDYVTEDDKKAYIEFLSSLLKDQPYVSYVYMTGILPIAKYSSGSELNMFMEYTMATKKKYCEYFGFTDKEVDELYRRYFLSFENKDNVNISREELRKFYNGYYTLSGNRVYNPRSVVCALKDNQLSNYWTSSGPYDEIFYYIRNNVAELRDDLALMVSGTPVPAKIQEYSATSMKLITRDEIFSAMVVYGFLSYENGKVSIPNRELMEKFTDMLRKESSLGYVFSLAKESDRMLKATLELDTNTMLAILEHTHNTEIPLLSYNKEADLTVVVTLVYLSARNYYRMEREDKAGIGYVDFIFYPENPKDDGIILELKVDHTAEEAIQQIKEKQYVLKFQPKLGERQKYFGRILAVGIAYDKNTKKHSCKVEVIKFDV